MKFGTYT